MIGSVARVPDFIPAGRLTQDTVKLVFNESDEATKTYIYWLLRTPQYREYCAGRAMGSAVVALSREDFLSYPVPPLTRPRAHLVELLELIERRCRVLREANATLEAIAQALFKSWFVDFDPVRAKAEKREPEGLDADTAALFPDGFEESNSQLVPRGWSVRSIYDVSTVVYGAPFASKRFNADRIGRPLIRIRDLKDEAPGVYTDEVHPKGYVVQPGDLVVGMDGEFRAYLWGGEPAWLNQRVCVFQPIDDISPAFVHLSIKPLLAAVEATETATTVIHLGKNDIDRFRVLVPTISVLEAFGGLSTPIYNKIVQNKQTASSLAALRDALLPRLISGQLRIPEAEALLENAA
ncbi:restriction endonuclease subunit S [Burkholderia sp. SR8]|uniref:restriction endonuclease subunit S n=1 Tax=Burkholderia sp. SR8 TaxID=3062277 RepID=UPI0040649403